jgi:large subunit ribosomal protein L21
VRCRSLLPPKIKRLKEAADRAAKVPFGCETFEFGARLADGVRVRAGTPFVTDAIVTAQIVGHGRGPKIRVFKYKNKTRSRKTRGHRQEETTLRITKIEA